VGERTSNGREGRRARVSGAHEFCNKCTLCPPPPRGDPQGGLFIGAVRMVGNNVRTVPLTARVTLSVQPKGHYRHFTSRKHFMLDLSGHDRRPPLQRLHLEASGAVAALWTSGLTVDGSLRPLSQTSFSLPC
jgi:hypothetical protein